MAEDTLQRLFRFWEKHPNSLISARLGEELYKARRRDEAIELLTDGIAKHPSYTTGYIVLGRLLFDMNRLEESENFTNILLQLDPCNEAAYKLLADIAFKRRDSENGIKNLMNILWFDPGNVIIKQTLENWKKELLGKVTIREESAEEELQEGKGITNVPSESAEELSPVAEELAELTESVYAQPAMELPPTESAQPDSIQIELPNEDILETSEGSSEKIEAEELPEEIQLTQADDELLLNEPPMEVSPSTEVGSETPSEKLEITRAGDEIELPKEPADETGSPEKNSLEPMEENKRIEDIIRKVDSGVEIDGSAEGKDEELELALDRETDSGEDLLLAPDNGLSDDEIIVEDDDEFKLSNEKEDSELLKSDSEFKLSEDTGDNEINDDSIRGFELPEESPFYSLEESSEQDLNELTRDALESVESIEAKKTISSAGDKKTEGAKEEKETPSLNVPSGSIPMTPTMAEIYASQGQLKKAIMIYQNLLQVTADSETQGLYKKRIGELSELLKLNGNI